MKPQIGIVVPAYNEERTIESLLISLAHQTMPAPIYIVDNGSTDSTIDKITEFHVDHPHIDINIIHEPEKGTGAAADTGMRAAIALGHHIIARTDADCQVSPRWVETMYGHFASHPETQLLGGYSRANHDTHYRSGDDWQYMAGVHIVFALRALQARRRGYATPVLGHNMATRADAYLRVGGFPRTAVELLDEDIAYGHKIIDTYGATSVANSPALVVDTSMRRVREYGRLGTILHHSFPSRRLRHRQKADVR